jgi:hypothetical protein
MSNPAMPGIVKIGESNNIPRRLKEANKPETWKSPYPYKVECALITLDHKAKEKDIHTFLIKQGKQINGGMNREFFSVTPAEVIPLLKLMEGEFIDSETFLLLSQLSEEHPAESEEDNIAEASVSDVTTVSSIPSIRDFFGTRNNTPQPSPGSDIRAFFDSPKEDHAPTPLITRYKHSREITRAEFESFDGKQHGAYKIWRRDKQGFSKKEYIEVYTKEMNGSPALRWDIDHLSWIFKENYQWAQQLKGILTEDCFPEYYVTS